MDDLHLASILRTPLGYVLPERRSIVARTGEIVESRRLFPFFSTFGLVFPHLKVSGLSNAMLLYNITANANSLAKHVHLLDQQ